jgi:DNA repair exonuclease SbcCD ATPase subunit
MKLISVELENWRRHSKLKIKFDDRATVIYGPNESGKSTLMEALSRALFDRSSSHGDEIRRLKPLTAIGNVSSSVKLEFSLKGVNYMVEKTFNHNAGTKLFKLNSGNYTLLDQDESADQYLTKILEASLPSKGTSKQSQWGPFQWLWAPQTSRELPAAGEGDPTISLHLDKEAIITTPRFQRMQSAVDEDYSKYFTRTGKPTAASPISAMEAELDDLRQKKVDYENELRVIDQDVIKLKDLESQLPKLVEELQKTIKQLDEAKSESTDFSIYESRLEASKSKLSDLSGKIKYAENAIKSLKDSRMNVMEYEKKVRDSGSEVQEHKASRLLIEKSLKEKDDAVDGLEQRLTDATDLLEDARLLLNRSLIRADFERLNKKLERISVLNAQIDAKRKEQIPLFPDREELERFRNAETRLKILKNKLNDNGLNLTLIPGKSGVLDVKVDGEKLERGHLKAVGTEIIGVSHKNFGTVKVEAKLRDARDVKNEIERQESFVNKTLKKYSVKSSEELLRMGANQERIINELKAITSERKGIDDRTDKELNDEKIRLQVQLNALDKVKRVPKSVEKNSTQGDLKRLLKDREAGERKVRKLLEATKKERDSIKGTFNEEDKKYVKADTDLTNFSEELKKAKEEESALVLKYGSIEVQESNLKSYKKEYYRINKEKEALELKIEEMRNGPINKMIRLEKQKENDEKIVQDLREQINKVKGGIEKESLKGTYSKLADIQSRMEEYEDAIERETIIAESLKLLKQLLQEQYHSLISKVTAPIQGEVQRLINYITMSYHDRVELNEYLYPVRIGEQNLDADKLLEFEDGSSGLKEALTLCVRLAVATYMSDAESQCLVLDDPFIHVSSERANRIVELVNESIEKHRLQVIVLTHRPVEFSGLNCTMIDIGSV